MSQMNNKLFKFEKNILRDKKLNQQLGYEAIGGVVTHNCRDENSSTVEKSS